MIQDIKTLLKSKPLVIDGALGTQLETKFNKLLQEDGINIQSHPLWSALVLLKNPELIQEVHYDYLCSGANIITTSTYQASKRGLLEHAPGIENDDEVSAVYDKAIELAVEARLQYLSEVDKGSHSLTNKEIFICGSIGPFGAYLANGAEYTGEYDSHIIEQKELKLFHHDITDRFLNNPECDIIGFETIPNYSEFQQIIELMEDSLQKTNKPFYISLNFKDSKTICDGTPLSIVVDYLNERLSRSEVLKSAFIGLGCNCVPLESATDILSNISSLNKIHEFPLIAYPNAGLDYDLSKGEYSIKSSEKQVWEGLCREWLKKLNVRLVGGCCGSGPKEISIIRNVTDRFVIEENSY
ncbi:uncharacterized protein AC631_04684 [Debaryomyces fabryi]|uniref:Hcy-binding domain-containing protein n=1 Tax=Debaryomyces fabryi TaxID=58627 RepID=A0A0V1PTI8_9ASCO|nr:uncharacterized protein AC631_04684 [Debaryomyces fabryi]KRZ99559.1 hypothetical protein AC631_04684 [Debaryomyces fabryi]CUM57075.1 unnamed protein product [Debaryomyces fabryi]